MDSFEFNTIIVAIVVSLLEKNEAPWVIVTNGRLWRLYARQTHSRATNYYELDAEEVSEVYARFTALADRKKNIYDQDLLSILPSRIAVALAA